MKMEKITPQPKQGIIQKLYQWVLSWANSPYAIYGLFILAFAESSFFPIPPDALLLALAFGKPKKALYFAGICTVASVLGGILGYYIGFALWDNLGSYILNQFDPKREIFEHIKVWATEWGFLGILAASITPIPYKVFTIAAGVLHFHFLEFCLASLLGRGFRFFVEGILIYWKGEECRVFIEKYLNWFFWGGMLLVVVMVLFLL